jgi:hypothetical protein
MLLSVVLLQLVCIALVAVVGLVVYSLVRPSPYRWAQGLTLDMMTTIISLIRLADGKPPIQLATMAPTSLKFLIKVAEHVRNVDPEKVVVVGNAGFAASLAALMNHMGAHGRIVSVVGDDDSPNLLLSRLAGLGFGERSTVVVSQSSKQTLDGISGELTWYDLEASFGSAEIMGADLLVLPVFSRQTRVDRLAAGPSLLPRLSASAHIFIEDGRRRKDRGLSRKWRNAFPDLGIRQVPGIPRVQELFFLEHKIKGYLTEQSPGPKPGSGC